MLFRSRHKQAHQYGSEEDAVPDPRVELPHLLEAEVAVVLVSESSLLSSLDPVLDPPLDADVEVAVPLAAELEVPEASLLEDERSSHSHTPNPTKSKHASTNTAAITVMRWS